MGQTELHDAAYDGDISTVERLLNSGSDIHAKNRKGDTPLHLAALKGHLQVFDLLLGADADPNARNCMGNTPLYSAVEGGHANLIEKFLKCNRFDLENCNDMNHTLLHLTILKGNIQLIKFLVGEGANMYNRNKTGNTGAHHAAFNGRCDVLRTLLDLGFDVNYKNDDGNTLLHLAAREGHSNFVNILISKGAQLDFSNKHGNSPVFLAAKEGHTHTVLKLIQARAQPYKPIDGRSVMHAAALGDRLHTLQALATNLGEHIDKRQTWNGRTAEDCASDVGSQTTWWLRKQRENTKQTSTLYDYSWNHCKDDYEGSGSNIIKRSKKPSSREKTWIAKSIEDGDIVMHYMDEQGNTMLHAAVESNNIPTIKALVDSGALLVARNHKHKTPIDIAKIKGVPLQQFLYPEASSPLDSRIASHLYTVLLNLIAQPVCRDIGDNGNQEPNLDREENFDKKVQKRKLEVIKIVSKLLTKGVPHDLTGDCNRHLLLLAITTNNRTLLPILLAAGLPLTTTDSGLSIVQLAWLTPDLTTWVGMVVTRAIIHRLQAEREIAVEDETDPRTEELSKILDKCIDTLIQDLSGRKPWEAQFRNPKNATLTQLYATACSRGATVTAGYIWKAGASNFERVEPYNCTALEAAVSAREYNTAMRLVLDMRANPFIVGDEDKIPIDEFPDKEHLLEIMLGQEYRRLDRLMVKVKDDGEKKEFQQMILLLVVLHLQYKSSKVKGRWKSFLILLLKAHSQPKREETLSGIEDREETLSGTEDREETLSGTEDREETLSGTEDMEETLSGTEDREETLSGTEDREETLSDTEDWMIALGKSLVDSGVEGIKFKTVNNVSEEIDRIHKAVDLNITRKEINTDPFYYIFTILQDNFSGLNIPSFDEFNLEQKYLLNKALQISCEQHFPLLLHLLISLAQLDVNSTLNEICQTKPLHHAAKNGNSSSVGYLLQCDAISTQRDRSGNLPVDYAYMYGHKQIGDYLIQFMKKSDNFDSEMKSIANSRWNGNRAYLKLCGLDPKSEVNSRCLHVETFESLLERRLDCIKRVWKHKGIRKAAADILVNYRDGEAREVREKVNESLIQLKSRIAQNNPLFDGELKYVGSSEDDVRLYCPDEYDCNLVLNNVSAYPDGELKATLVTLKDKEASLSGHKQRLEVHLRRNSIGGVNDMREELGDLLQGSNFVDKFYNIASKALAEIDFQECKLKPLVPGIKRTQVGIALSFLWLGKKYPMLFVDVDLVPTIKAPWPRNLRKPDCDFESCHLEEVLLNSVGEGEWRLSFGHVETQIMKNLNRERRGVFVASKMILASLKTENWVPQSIKCNFMYWCSKMFSLPSKGGFVLKNSFFCELREISDGKDWEDEMMLQRICSIFERMCRMDQVPVGGEDKEIQAPIVGPKPVKAYFGGDTEKASMYLCAPEVLQFLRSIDDSEVTQPKPYSYFPTHYVVAGFFFSVLSVVVMWFIKSINNVIDDA